MTQGNNPFEDVLQERLNVFSDVVVAIFEKLKPLVITNKSTQYLSEAEAICVLGLTKMVFHRTLVGIDESLLDDNLKQDIDTLEILGKKKVSYESSTD